MITFFLKYLLIGFIASIPIGPISVLIISRTVNKSRRHGYFSGAGAALSDSIYALLAGLGLTIFMNLLEENEKFIRVGGAFIIIILGLYIAIRKNKLYQYSGNVRRMSLVQDYFSTFLLTATNPFIIFIYIGLFAGFGVDNQLHGWKLIWQFLSIYLGCNFWWFILTYFVANFKKRLKDQWLQKFNTITGITIIILALASIISFTFK